jgi:predicted secreted protein
MGWLAGIFVYALLWWLVLFAVLPWGVRREETPEAGHDPGAPANPNLWWKLLATTIVAGIVWVGVYYVIDSGLIPLRPTE